MPEVKSEDTVKSARASYFNAVGFPDNIYEQSSSIYPIGFLKIRLPNTNQIPLQDIRHIATGYFGFELFVHRDSWGF